MLETDQSKLGERIEAAHTAINRAFKKSMRGTIPPTSGVQFEMPWLASTYCGEKSCRRRAIELEGTSSFALSPLVFHRSGDQVLRRQCIRGVYFYRGHYYSPTLQRFVSEDPIGVSGGINLYAYTGNDPVVTFSLLLGHGAIRSMMKRFFDY
jgi:RHS repeat-associated protein